MPALSPGSLLLRGADFSRRRIRDAYFRRRDRGQATYGPRLPGAPRGLFRSAPAWVRAIPGERADHYLAHRFDLLGSGWTEVRHGAECRGLQGIRFAPGPALDADPAGRWLAQVVNPENLERAGEVWRLADPGYRPIDWQLDFKSGYRWSARTWYRDVAYGEVPGADIKAPWELGRLQHLPQMAIFAVLHPDRRERAAREIRNQVLDFVAANPPRFGVQWACTMDVAIRAANLVLASEVLRAAAIGFDAQFDAVLRASVADHGRHIAGNLERSGPLRANHYFANVAGLAYAAAWLPPSPETRRWSRFANEALAGEIHHQFNPDGSHFEGSTAYHRLCAEMAVFAAALGGTAGLPAGCLQRIAGMAEFAGWFTKPNGVMHQVGDNDSGRFFKLDARDDPSAPLDCAPLLSAAEALLRSGRTDGNGNDAACIRALTGEPAPAAKAAVPAGPALRAATQTAAPRPGRAHERRRTFAAPRPPSLLEGLEHRLFPDFGLFVFRSARLYVGIVCRAPGWRGPTGHLHHDLLSVELQIDGEDLLADPGSYVYTPFPVLRNEYRSVHAHFTPWWREDEPAPLDSLFALEQTVRCSILAASGTEFRASITASGVSAVRTVTIHPDRVEILDQADHALPPGLRRPVPFSVGYGQRSAA
jgi:hypothetical protein